ncbi:MAG: hypothetical protein VXV94_07720, partial [Cyanobacteriota bacterium]|nr:hypothetical protein [Cyanobacteriota bacterium]
DVFIAPIKQITHAIGTNDVHHLQPQHPLSSSRLSLVVIRDQLTAQRPFGIQEKGRRGSLAVPLRTLLRSTHDLFWSHKRVGGHGLNSAPDPMVSQRDARAVQHATF